MTECICTKNDEGKTHCRKIFCRKHYCRRQIVARLIVAASLLSHVVLSQRRYCRSVVFVARLIVALILFVAYIGFIVLSPIYVIFGSFLGKFEAFLGHFWVNLRHFFTLLNVLYTFTPHSIRFWKPRTRKSHSNGLILRHWPFPKFYALKMYYRKKIIH